MLPSATIIRELLREQLPPCLYEHVVGTAECAYELALAQGCGKEELLRVELGALLHDNCRHWQKDALILAAKKLGYEPDELEMRETPLLHARVGAYRLELEYGILDSEVFEAVFCHTVGSRGMRRAARIIYCADKMERRRDYPEAANLWAQAETELPRLCLAVVSSSIEHHRSKGYAIHPATNEFYNELREETRHLG